MFRRKPEPPVDRALQDVERQLAEVRRQLRSAERPVPPATTGFVKDMLTPARRQTEPTYHAKRKDLFDVPADPLRELEPAPVATSRAVSPELFHASGGNGTRAVAADSSAQDKLLTYLSAGSVRACGPHRPLKGVQRRERNRFFGWIGLAVATLWLLYVMVR